MIQTDHEILPRIPDVVIINQNKKTCRIVDFAVSTDYRVKIKKSKKGDKYWDLSRKLKKAVEHEGNGDTNCNWRLNGPQRKN